MHLNWQWLNSPNPPREGKLIRIICLDSMARLVNMYAIRTKVNRRYPLPNFPGLSKEECVAGPVS